MHKKITCLGGQVYLPVKIKGKVVLVLNAMKT